MTIETLKAWGKALRGSPIAGRLATLARFVLLGAVIFHLINELQVIGWQDVAQNLPKNPFFYLLLAVTYMAQPVGEYLVYRLIWLLKPLVYLGVFLRKRVYNFAVFGYSGEAYLYLWARQQPRLAGRDLMSNIKDNLILSASASNTMTVAMVALFLATGQLQRFFQVSPDSLVYFIAAGLLAVLLIAIVVRFRHTILGLPAVISLRVLAIHSTRLVSVLILQALQWAIILPMVPLETWLVLITAQLVLTRIPFLPNQDLMFLGLVISVAGFVEAPQSAVAGLFVTIGALNQILHLVVFLATSFGVPSRAPKLSEQT